MRLKVAIAGLLLTTPAAVSLAPPAAAQDFAGPRVEVSAGYDALGSDGRYEDFPDTLDGAHVRAAIGYDAAVMSRLVVGLEASIGTTFGAQETVQPGNDAFSFEPSRDIDVLARIGYQAGSRTLVYLKAGWANARVDLMSRELVGDGEYDITRQSADDDGVRLGAGIEQRLSGRLYGKAEYRYTDFGDGYAYQPGTARNQLLLGIGLRF